MEPQHLEICVLGELRVLRAGRPQPLPKSRKSRALLGYLVTTGSSHLRERLCDLLWDGPDDPRAALRWTLTKLRPFLDDDAVVRLVTERDRVSFEAHGADVDLTAVQAVVGIRVSDATTDALRQALARFHGDFLDGLEIPSCYAFAQWRASMRESVRALRVSMLTTLADRLRDVPDEALPFARARVAIEPFVEEAHIAVIELLGDLGRVRDATQQYETCRRVLRDELGVEPTAALERARQALRSTAPPPASAPLESSERIQSPVAPQIPSTVTTTAAQPIVGRTKEIAEVSRLVAAAADRRAREVLLVSGDPGIGKSRLLEEVAAQVRRRGGTVLVGRAFEAEMIRPYGPWIDALRSIGLGDAVESLREDLAPMLPELGATPSASGDRNRLFSAVARLLVALSQRAPPLVLLLDDVQWFDEASAALAHFVARELENTGAFLACSARSAELQANAQALALVRALRGDRRLCHLALVPLEEREIAALVAATEPSVDAHRVIAESGGNPLFVLEITRAMAGGSPEGSMEMDVPPTGDSADVSIGSSTVGAIDGPLARSPTLDALIGDRLSRLDERSRNAVLWASALGHSFDIDVLNRVIDLDTGQLLSVIGDLERHGIIRPVGGGGGRVGYDFAHDLVRRAAYRQLSAPRARLVHSQISSALVAMDGPAGALAGDIAHHAALAGDNETAATACIRAGERSIRMFAFADAIALAERGMRLVRTLPRDTRLRLHVDLFRVLIYAGGQRGRELEVESRLGQLVEESRALGMHAQVQAGFHLVSMAHYRGGDWRGADEETMRAVEAGRATEPATRARSLASAARCLAIIGRETRRAKELLTEAEAVAEAFRIDVPDIVWTRGLLSYHVGEFGRAAEDLERALADARRDEDHWKEWECLAQLARIDLERGRPDVALLHCGVASEVAAKLGEGSEGAVTAALRELARLLLGETDADDKLELALAALRAIDAKGLLAYTLIVAAGYDLDRGSTERARSRAEEALAAAEVVNRRPAATQAREILNRVASMEGSISTPTQAAVPTAGA